MKERGPGPRGDRRAAPAAARPGIEHGGDDKRPQHAGTHPEQCAELDASRQRRQQRQAGAAEDGEDGDGERSVGELVDLVGEPQPKVSNHLACLRWCGFVDGRREHRTVYYRIADRHVLEMIELARGLLQDNAEHVAACRTIDAGPT